MTLDQCLGANRPLTFVVTESDVEVLRHIDKSYPENLVFVYSTTLTNIVQLKALLNPSSKISVTAESTISVLDMILTGKRGTGAHRETISGGGAKEAVKSGFTTFVMLDCDAWINDPQVIRKIKDILFKYQIDEDFTVNMVCVSHRVCVPAQLERLSEMVFFDLPTEEELKRASDDLSNKLELKGEKAPSEEVINNLKGMTIFEVEQAFLQSHYLYKKIDLGFIRDFKKNALAKTDLLQLLESNVNLDDVGGLDRMKEWMTKANGGWTVEGKKFGLPLMKGILMVGLPGCGKSLACKALGNSWGLPVVDFDPSRVFSSRVGDSESNMRRALQIVNNLSPCILMIDEIEKGLSGLQSSSFSDSGVTARVIRSFLVWMQENDKPVFVVATANNITSLPPEMISRFDETFFVNLPSPAERRDIFKIHIAKLKRDPSKFDLDMLAAKSQDLSGREIEQTLREAMYRSFHNGTDLKNDTIIQVLGCKTTLVTTMAEQLRALVKWVGWDKTKQDGQRARYASTPDSQDMNRIQSEIDSLIKDVEKNPLGGKSSF